ncbi:hypothetical protein B0H11DRAFT_2215007 [Mycena galericulata]|nr:hypothetical protein B0H11DRAFT_2233352 [Mycena galericulata]KAJ7511170.1 hypothetical protein B0H11DRAFT_2215007 [Mycena galericulata]
MPENTEDDEYEDPEFLALIANLDLADDDSPAPPPRTPSPRHDPPPAYRHTFPIARTHHYTPPVRPTLYRFQSPTSQGVTPDWSLAGAATQGVPDSTVSVIQTGGPRTKNTGGKKAAYAVFCGLRFGVFLTWRETQPLVIGVPFSIFRGYKTVQEARAAYEYALQRSWVRTCNTAVSCAIPALPRPAAELDQENPLNGTDPLDDKWFIVYRGIAPGVYRSHLECQLNTIGVSGALHESVVGKAAALAKYAAAVRRREVGVVTPPYLDVFS